MCLLCTCVAIISASIVGVLVWYFFFRYNDNDLHISNRVITEHEFKTSLKFDIEKKYYKPTDYGRWKYFDHRKRHSTSGIPWRDAANICNSLLGGVLLQGETESIRQSLLTSLSSTFDNFPNKTSAGIWSFEEKNGRCNKLDINLKPHTISEVNCTESLAFVCQQPQYESCVNEMMEEHSKSQYVNGTCYKLYTKNANWGTASMVCNQRNLTLLKVGTESILQKLETSLQWIKSEDFFQMQNSTIFWTSSQVKETCYGFQVSLITASKSKGLVHVDCKRSMPFICQGLPGKPCT